MALGLSFACGLRGGRALLAPALAAIAPDFDLVLRPFGPEYMRFHHGPTHSFAGAALIGLLCALALPRPLRAGLPRGRLVLACVLAGLAHVPLDYHTGLPFGPKDYGVEALWPWSRERFCAEQPFFGAFGLDQDGFLLHLLKPEALPIYGREALVSALAMGLGAAFGLRAVSPPPASLPSTVAPSRAPPRRP